MSALRHFVAQCGGIAHWVVVMLAGFGLFVAAPAVPQSRWKAGIHYEVLPAQKAIGGRNGRVRVLEFFSYPCGSCYTLEPALSTWQRSRAQLIELVRVPVVYLPQVRAYARLHYTLQALGRSDLNPEIYDSLYRKGRALQAASEAETFALQLGFAREHGIEERQFTAAYESRSVADALRNADLLTRFYLVEGTPTLVIAGRYKSMAGQAGGYEELIALADELARAEYRRCCVDRGEVK